jgi:hypothetical protein
MAMTVQGTPLEEMLLKARSLLEWAKDLGVPVGRGNWLEISIGKMEKILAEPSMSKRRKLAQKFYNELVDSQHNVSDLSHIIFVYEHIGPQDREILKDKMTKALGGAQNVRDELPSNTQPRDTLFELSVCARFNSMGFFALLCEPNPDVMAYRRKSHIAIECKRVFTSKSIDTQLSEANKQLSERKASKKADLRVICVDVTRAFTGGTGHLQGDRQEVIDELVLILQKEGSRVMELMDVKAMYAVDAIILYFQDYIEPTGQDVYSIAAITQSLVVINPLHKRSRRKKAVFTLKRLDPKGEIGLTTRIVTPPRKT